MSPDVVEAVVSGSEVVESVKGVVDVGAEVEGFDVEAVVVGFVVVIVVEVEEVVGLGEVAGGRGKYL